MLRKPGKLFDVLRDRVLETEDKMVPPPGPGEKTAPAKRGCRERNLHRLDSFQDVAARMRW
jgi:hypothetical protein